MENMIVTPVDASNIEILLDLIEQFATEFISEQAGSSVRNYYQCYLADHGVASPLISYLLYKDSMAIGCVQLFRISHPPMLDTAPYEEGEVMNFYVKKSERNKGYGKELMNHLLSASQKAGIRCLRLNSSPEAERLYERHGFKSPPFRAMIRWSKV